MVFLLLWSIVVGALLIVIRLLRKGRAVPAPPEEFRCSYCEVMEEHHKASTHGVTDEQLAEHERMVMARARAAGFSPRG